MKTLITTVVLWAVISMSAATAQKSDTLAVFIQDEVVAKIYSPDLQQLRNSAQVGDLVKNFQSKLKSLESELPEYLIYDIHYTKNKKLVIEEIEGIVKYKMNETNELSIASQSIARLKQGNLGIQIFFQDLDELANRDYASMMLGAVSKLGDSPGKLVGLLKRVYSPKKTYDFSYSDGQMMKKSKYKLLKKPRLLIHLNAQIGIYKTKPLYEYSADFGLKLRKSPKPATIFFKLGQAFQYDSEFNQAFTSNFAGFKWKPSKWYSISADVPFGFATVLLFRNVDFRYSVSLYPLKGGYLTLSFFKRKKFGVIHLNDISYLPAVSFGFRF